MSKPQVVKVTCYEKNNIQIKFATEDMSVLKRMWPIWQSYPAEIVSPFSAISEEIYTQDLNIEDGYGDGFYAKDTCALLPSFFRRKALGTPKREKPKAVIPTVFSVSYTPAFT